MPLLFVKNIFEYIKKFQLLYFNPIILFPDTELEITNLCTVYLQNLSPVFISISHKLPLPAPPTPESGPSGKGSPPGKTRWAGAPEDLTQILKPGETP